MKTQRKIFISYSHSDKNWVKEFAQLMREQGESVWLDVEEIRPGDFIPETIEEGLRESGVVVFLVSKERPRQPNMLFELGAAIGMGKRIIAIVPSDLDPSNLPQSLRVRRYLVKDIPATTATQLLSELQ